jgi:phenylpyruvate tautomerase PptA (4-oxalocrotonate tautomerase family)
MDNAAQEEEKAALVSALADIITKHVEDFAEDHKIDICRVTLAVASQLLDDAMNNGHAKCAFALASSAAEEALRRMYEELSPEAKAMVIKETTKPQEH